MSKPRKCVSVNHKFNNRAVVETDRYFVN